MMVALIHTDNCSRVINPHVVDKLLRTKLNRFSLQHYKESCPAMNMLYFKTNFPVKRKCFALLVYKLRTDTRRKWIHISRGQGAVVLQLTDSQYETMLLRGHVNSRTIIVNYVVMIAAMQITIT